MEPLEHISGNYQEGTDCPRSEGLSLVKQGHGRPLKQTIHFVRRFAAKIGLSERRKEIRVSALELNVNYALGVKEKQLKIKDISLTGAYLVTPHRWLVGTSLQLTLQGKNRARRESPSQVRLQAKVVRVDKSGVGVTFVPEHIDAQRWLTFVSQAISLVSEQGAVRVFQMAKALAFLAQISPSSEGRFLELLRSELSDERIERVLEIALKADDLSASRNSAQKSTALPNLVLGILREGSKTNEEAMQRCWAGLLAAASLEGSNHDENLRFAALLSKLEPVHVRILTVSGQKAMRAGFLSRTTNPQVLHCKVDEIKQITQIRNVAVLESALNRLYEVGLLELTLKPFGCALPEDANLTPTGLGLAFYQACTGQQKLPEFDRTIEAAS